MFLMKFFFSFLIRIRVRIGMKFRMNIIDIMNMR